MNIFAVSAFALSAALGSNETPSQEGGFGLDQ